MNVRKKGSRSVVRCGRAISSQELESARETVKLCSGLSRAELAETICEHWGWVTASGTGKVTACLNVLEELEQNGEIQLPAKHKRPNTERVRGAKHTKRTAPPDETLVGKLADVSPVRLEIVEGPGNRPNCGMNTSTATTTWATANRLAAPFATSSSVTEDCWAARWWREPPGRSKRAMNGSDGASRGVNRICRG